MTECSMFNVNLSANETKCIEMPDNVDDESVLSPLAPPAVLGRKQGKGAILSKNGYM